MRSYPVVDDDFVEEASYPGVTPADAPRQPFPPTTVSSSRREAWHPRKDPDLSASAESEPPENIQPTRSPQGSRQTLRLAAFGIVCLSIIAAIITWRAVASEAADVIEPRDAVLERDAELDAEEVASAATEPSPEQASGALGGITKEIQVLQPTYTVAPGDNLANIARRHGTTVEALASINKLENRNSLSVGQRLIIP